jgi:hypothetical protein
MQNNINLLKKAAPFILVAVIGATMTRPALAADKWTNFGSVQDIVAGWVQDTVAVHHSAPVVNPDSCSVTNGGYATSPSDPGHSLFHTIILSAFLNRKEVNLLISGCVYSKPRIIGVVIR